MRRESKTARFHIATDSEGETPADTATMTVTRTRTRVATAAPEGDPPGGVVPAAVVREESLDPQAVTRVASSQKLLTLPSPQILPRVGTTRRIRRRRRKRRRNQRRKRMRTSLPRQALMAAITPATTLRTGRLGRSFVFRSDARGRSLTR